MHDVTFPANTKTYTEHMFFQEDRLPLVQEMIMAKSKARRLSALEKLLPMQRNDFEGILRAMKGCPAIIRLLAPPHCMSSCRPQQTLRRAR
jgi:pyruvate,orthophosphate dikinase